jgi:hypothetical protein
MRPKDRPYGWHTKRLKNAQSLKETFEAELIRRAMEAGHGHVEYASLRKYPEYETDFRSIDSLENVIQIIKDDAVDAMCAHRQGVYDDKFAWYSQRDAIRWRREHHLGGKHATEE